MDRRAFLKIGLSGLASLGWSALPIVQHKKLILIWLGGGHSALETFNPKPDAPTEIRGPFKATQTSVPGLHFSELLPNLANIAHKLAVFRTIVVRNGDHYSASQEILAHGGEQKTLSAQAGRGAMIPYMLCEAQPAYSYIEQAHQDDDWMKIEYHNGRYCPPNLVPEVTLGRRAELLHQLESPVPGTAKYHAQRETAFALMHGGGPLENCFKISIHDTLRYGGTSFGECVLLAKRLTAAGVGAVTVVLESNGGWDLHDNLFDRYRSLTAALDTALARLIVEIADDTICLVCSEFGRTPKVNSSAGRDHWPQSNTAILFGARVRPTIVGRTDNMLMPKDHPVPSAWLRNTVLAVCGDMSVPPNELVTDVIA